MIYVVDASVAAKWFLRENLHEKALHLLDYEEYLRAPDLLVAEVANIAWKKAVRDQISVKEAQIIAIAVPHYIATLFPSAQLVERAIAMAIALNHPVYDCIYLSCAEAAGGRLITADRRLCEAVRNTEFEDLAQYLGETDFRIDVLPPLTIPLNRVHHVIELARNDAETRQQVDRGLWGEDDPEEGFRVRPAQLSGHAWPSVPRYRLVTYLKSLSPGERAELLALMWLGRGYEEDRIEWPRLLEHAHGMGSTAPNLRYMLGLADCLETGLAYFRKIIGPEANR